MSRKKYKALSYNDRNQLKVMYEHGESPSDIAAELGVHTATIYRELQRGYTGQIKSFVPEYSADVAQSKVSSNLKKRGRASRRVENESVI